MIGNILVYSNIKAEPRKMRYLAYETVMLMSVFKGMTKDQEE